ncbi:hypothetical protein J2T55_001975 [Methylohalomonas lacus]|uniref:Uncharacterized protein n=1 Tax=Methylohalomonas lacus TaxID=398773 RepID=A0AAE3HNS7_9GAMM|nr:hypothetical protein [Methylohalomonas lacus]
MERIVSAATSAKLFYTGAVALLNEPRAPAIDAMTAVHVYV